MKVVNGNALAQYVLEQVPNEKEREFRRKPTAFVGETAFTMVLLDVTSPKPLKACFLQGHGEHRIDSGDDQAGYLKFASVLHQNYIQVEPLSLLGTNTVPMDCNLLVIAGPRETIPDLELEKIEQYLNQGGRLLALFNCYPILTPGQKGHRPGENSGQVGRGCRPQRYQGPGEQLSRDRMSSSATSANMPS